MRPGTAVPCRRGDKLLGVDVPGRNAGRVVGCAVPEKPRPGRAPNDESRVQFGLPGLGPTLRRSTARRRLRDAAFGGPQVDDPAAVEMVAHEQLRARDPIPYPTGREYPHRPGTSPCDPEHVLWRDYDSRLEDARERAAMQLPEDASAAEFDAATARILAAEAPELATTARGCAKAYQGRAQGRAAKATQSTTRERAQARAAFVARGGDTGSAEYADDVLGILAGKRTKGRKR